MREWTLWPRNSPTNPSHPERICWGCDLYCPAKALACGNGADRTMHPVELFGEDWDRMEDRLDKPVREVQQAQSN
ncbi:DUF3079 domain-containing protein [Pseudomonas sp. P1B16]|nr:DUF3079 domain-containing protein [Pseudomonas sp. P1B16]WPM29264.1 DUF3079 domain-containing protein [Pseudomonas sp. P1B16]